jgi:hypothetical protein
MKTSTSISIIRSLRKLGLCPFYGLSAYLASCLIFSAPLSADIQKEIKILDAEGFLRASQQTALENKVLLSVVGPDGKALDSGEFTLINKSTGKKLVAKSVNGVVTFDAVTPGAWVVSTSSAGVTVTSVAIGDAAIASAAFGATSTISGASLGAATVSATLPIAIAGGVVVSAAAVAVEDSNSSDNSQDEEETEDPDQDLDEDDDVSEDPVDDTDDVDDNDDDDIVDDDDDEISPFS